MAEIPFESLQGAHETTRGTAIAAPTHLIHWPGTITPEQTVQAITESRGTLFGNYRNKVTRRGGSWQASGDADVNLLPWLLNMVVAPVTSPSTPGGATNARLWTFTRSGTADNIKASTIWFGDPNIQNWSADYAMVDSFTFSATAADEGVAQGSISGRCGFPAKVSAPTQPAAIAGDTLAGQAMQLWIDTATIGSTAVTGRFISAEITIPTGVTYKHLASGPTTSLDYAATGRDKTRATAKIVLELPDMTQYDLWAAATSVKMRIRFNGALIESTFYNYFEFDIYGPLQGLAWGSNQASNRTIELMVMSDYDATAGADYIVKVQNARASL